MKSSIMFIARPRTLALASLIVSLAACTGSSNNSRRADVDIRGTNPNQTQPRNVPQQTTAPARPTGGDIIAGDGYQSVVARDGDTVASLASRNGLSASELGSYNGLQPTHRLRKGDELILPPRPAGTTAQQTANLPLNSTTAPTGSTSIESRPLVVAEAPADDTIATDAGTLGGPLAAPSDAPAPSQPPDGWSPDAAAAAIDRSVGLKSDGTLGAPPSAVDPVPPEPTPARDLESPDLSQYQTAASAPDSASTPSERPADAQTSDPVPDTRVAAADPKPAPTPSAPRVKLRRPVKGPVAVGFNQGSGAQRNDGIDFAAPAGSTVVAAEAGEVALVSESLGGLGTIVLVRHKDELLTVYGRIDGVVVRKGDLVTRGQKIGVVSNAAAPAEPRMHFEVRRGATVLDPNQFL